MSRVGILGPCSEPLACLAVLPVCKCRPSRTVWVAGGGLLVWRAGWLAGRRTTNRWACMALVCRQEYHGRVTAANPGHTVSGPRRRCRRRIKCRVQDHRCRARWMEPPWTLRTASSLHQLACQRRPPGSGAQGRAPHPDSNAKLQAHGPRSSRQLGGAQAQISVVERGWGPQIPGPIHFTDVQQLDYPLYRHVPSEQLHPSYPPEVPEYVPTCPAKGRKKKGTCS